MLQKLAKASQRAETKEKSFQKWSEERFQALDTKFNELDDIITRSIEEDQRRSMQRTFVTLMFVPVNILFWIANLVTSILPAALSLQQSAILSSALPSSSTTWSAAVMWCHIRVSNLEQNHIFWTYVLYKAFLAILILYIDIVQASRYH